MNEPLQIAVESKGHVLLKVCGSLTKEHVDSLKGTIAAAEGVIKERFAKTGKKVKVLLDFSEFDGTYDVEAMQLMIDFAKSNSEFVEKTAAFGTRSFQMVGEVIATLAGRKNITFFPTQEEALKSIDSA